MRLLCLAIAFAAAAGSAAQQDTCTVRTAPGRIFQTPLNAGGLHLVVNAGAKDHGVQVDTGSTGLAIPRAVIGRSRPVNDIPGLEPYIYYNSSKRAMCGEWVYTDLLIRDRANTQSVKIPNMPVLAIDYRCEGTEQDAPCKCTNRLSAADVGMMGVGFDRGEGMGTPRTNPFLNLPQMQAGQMQQGYIITSNTITLGMRQRDLANFQFAPLKPVENGTPIDWQQARGCVAISGGGATNPGQKTCGEILMDTGVSIMYLTYRGNLPQFQPPIGDDQYLWLCNPYCTLNGNQPATVTVTWPDSGAPVHTYAPASPQTFVYNGTSPQGVHLHSTGQLGADVFVNTSRQLLYSADYLYDATCGRIGFRRK